MSEGLEGFGGRDFVVPELVIVQNTTKEIEGLVDERTGAAVEQLPGTFADKKNKQSYGKKLNVILLQVDKKRLLFFDREGKKTPEDKGKTGRKCWSMDSIKPADAVPENQRQAINCEDCKYANRDLEYHLTLLDIDRSMEAEEPVVFRYIAKSTSLDPVRSLATTIKKRKKATRDFTLVMSAVNDDRGKGNFKVLNFSAVTPLEDNKLKAYAEEAYLNYCDSSSSAPSDAGEDVVEQGEARPF